MMNKMVLFLFLLFSYFMHSCTFSRENVDPAIKRNIQSFITLVQSKDFADTTKINHIFLLSSHKRHSGFLQEALSAASHSYQNGKIEDYKILKLSETNLAVKKKLSDNELSQTYIIEKGGKPISYILIDEDSKQISSFLLLHKGDQVYFMPL